MLQRNAGSRDAGVGQTLWHLDLRNAFHGSSKSLVTSPLATSKGRRSFCRSKYKKDSGKPTRIDFLQFLVLLTLPSSVRVHQILSGGQVVSGTLFSLSMGVPPLSHSGGWREICKKTIGSVPKVAIGCGQPDQQPGLRESRSVLTLCRGYFNVITSGTFEAGQRASVLAKSHVGTRYCLYNCIICEYT